MKILICMRCVRTCVHVSSTTSKRRVCGDFVDYNQLDSRGSTLGGGEARTPR